MNPNVHCNIINNSHDMEAAQMNGKEDVVYIDNGILYNNNKERMQSCHLWHLDGSRGGYAKMSDRERQILTYMWSLKTSFFQKQNLEYSPVLWLTIKL